ncbi:MAG: phosphotransferase, partial [Rhodospirillaceae bacterium]|nr:phosphotransferase [Rhodospirillaceae bacterium]
FLLLEDLGENTFTFSLNGGTDETKLYALAIDALVALHKMDGAKTTPNWLPDYSDEKLLAEAALFPDWYMPAVGLDDLNVDERAGYDAAWLEVLKNAKTETNTLVLRDFHVDNLVLIEGRDNIAACGLLDFQDAVIGHAAYDLMSLLEDARRDINPELKTKMLARYHAALGTKDIESFNAAFAILSANRHAKVIGIFTRLFVRDNKPVYLKHIARVWKLLELSLAHPALEPVNSWFKKYVPAEMRITPRTPKNLSGNNK